MDTNDWRITEPFKVQLPQTKRNEYKNKLISTNHALLLGHIATNIALTNVNHQCFIINKIRGSLFMFVESGCISTNK